MSNNTYQVTGFLENIAETKMVGANSDFAVKEFVVKTSENYPQLLRLELVQEKTEALNGVPVGQEVKAFFSIRGREWNDKIINSLRCYRLEPLGANKAPATQASPEQLVSPQEGETEEEPVF